MSYPDHDEVLLNVVGAKILVRAAAAAVVGPVLRIPPPPCVLRRLGDLRVLRAAAAVLVAATSLYPWLWQT